MSVKVKDLRHKEFLGRIVPKGSEKELDQKMKGRYKVHIPELMPHLEEDKGIYCKNHVHNWRLTDSDVGEYGSYYPLHSGTYVMVKFYANDYNTGYIDRIISDYEDDTDKEAQDCFKVKPALTDRDEQYVIFKTPKKWNIFYVNEDTQNEPNTVYLIYNRDNSPERRTVYRINESGIHIWTRDNQRIRIKEDEDTQVDGNGNKLTRGNVIIQVEGTANVSVDGKTDVWSGTSVNVDAPVINLNCGIAQKTPANEVKDLGPDETSEYQTGVGDKCDDRTDEYNIEQQDFDLSMFKK
jgi:hypothetical protein